MEAGSITALLSLLDDPDEEVYQQIRLQFLKLGEEAIPRLEECLYESNEPLVIMRTQELLGGLRRQKALEKLKAWQNSQQDDLLAAMIIIDQLRYPDTERQEIENQIDRIKLDVWLEMHYDLTSFEKVKILNHIFFEVHHFKGNNEDYYQASNSYLSKVLQNKLGNPISLGIIYSMVAQRLNIPVYGVNLPRHFILGYMSDAEEPAPDQYNDPSALEPQGGERDVFFYINAFNKGAVFNRAHVAAFLQQMNIKPEEKHFGFCSNVDIVKRVLRNLCNAKGGNEDESLKEIFGEMLLLLGDDADTAISYDDQL